MVISSAASIAFLKKASDFESRQQLRADEIVAIEKARASDFASRKMGK